MPGRSVPAAASAETTASSARPASALRRLPLQRERLLPRPAPDTAVRAVDSQAERVPGSPPAACVPASPADTTADRARGQPAGTPPAPPRGMRGERDTAAVPVAARRRAQAHAAPWVAAQPGP